MATALISAASVKSTKQSRGIKRKRLLSHNDSRVSPHALFLNSLAPGIELDRQIHGLSLAKAEVPFGLRIRIVAVRTLTVEDHDLFRAEQFATRVTHANCSPGGPAIPPGADRTNSKPVLPWKIVPVDLDLTLSIQIARVANDI